MSKSKTDYMREYRQRKREERLKIEGVKPHKPFRNSTQRMSDLRARKRKANLILSSIPTASKPTAIPNIVVNQATEQILSQENPDMCFEESEITIKEEFQLEDIKIKDEPIDQYDKSTFGLAAQKTQSLINIQPEINPKKIEAPSINVLEPLTIKTEHFLDETEDPEQILRQENPDMCFEESEITIKEEFQLEDNKIKDEPIDQYDKTTFSLVSQKTKSLISIQTDIIPKKIEAPSENVLESLGTIKTEHFLDVVNSVTSPPLTPAPKKTKKTPAERQRNYRLRQKQKKKKAQNINGNKPAKKTRADYMREYRLRKKLKAKLNSGSAEMISRAPVTTEKRKKATSIQNENPDMCFEESEITVKEEFQLEDIQIKDEPIDQHDESTFGLVAQKTESNKYSD